jgi:hypothetical protein
MENVDHLPEVIIEIYDVTAPECGYFVFWTNQTERMNVNVKPFILKEPDTIYPDKHHIKGDEVLYFKNFSSNIISFNKRFKEQSWKDAMKWEIYKIIDRGFLNRKAKNSGSDVFVRFVWSGEKVTKTTIEYNW